VIKYFVATCILFAMSFGNALAAAPATFDEIDADGNGFISKAEVKNRKELRDNWKKADKDKDNQLDVSEFSAFEGREMFQPAEDAEEPEPGAAPTM